MWYHDKSPRIHGVGGIRPQGRNFGESWWARRWIQVIESFDVGGRLGRGRTYARAGQVLSIDVQPGIIKAKVQGSRPTPYVVTIQVARLEDRNWKQLTAALNAKALYTAKLLAGGMPEEIETVAKDAGVPLFPTTANDLKTDCNCPDWSNPCKHVAAVYYIVAETLNRDPFLLLKLRGLEREALVKSLVPAKSTGLMLTTVRDPIAEVDAKTFWRPRVLVSDFSPGRVPTVSGTILLRLGPIPFWRCTSPIADALKPIYSAVSASCGNSLTSSMS